MEEVIEFIKPELIILIPVIHFIGSILKNSHYKDNLIPVTNGIVSIVLCALYVLGTSEITGTREFTLAVFTAITQGILCAGTATYANQIVKQVNK